MSSAASAWAWQQRVGRCKMLLLALADLADDRGCTRTPVGTLAEMIDRDRSTVIRQLAELEQGGLIERIGSRNAGGAQEVSRTRLLTSAAPVNAGSQTATPSGPEPEKTPSSRPSQSATRPGAAPDKAESQTATHKDQHPSSLLSPSSLPSNTTGPAPSPFQVHLRTVLGAGVHDLWRDWVRLGKLPQVTQEHHAAQWAAWIDEGRGDALREHTLAVIELGSYAHPWAGVKARMAKQAADVQAGAAAQHARTAGATCQPGERRRAPDGQVWTVEIVEYGLVYFEEPHAPLDLGDAIVRRWELVGGTS